MDENYRQIMYIRFGGNAAEASMVLGTVADLADEMKHREYADYEVSEVYGLDQLGDLRPLRWDVTGGAAFDENDYAYPLVTVHFPDGHRDTATYWIDGRV